MTTVNESYEIKRIQSAAAHWLIDAMAFLGDPKAFAAIHGGHLDTTQWRKDKQVVFAHEDHHDHRKNSAVVFSSPRYDPNLSDIWYGKPVKIDDIDLVDGGESKVFDNRDHKEEMHVAFEQEITYENSVEHSFSSTMTFDTTLETETTVSGSYAGVEAEEKVTASFGFTDEKSESETKAESESKTTKIAIDFTVPPGECTLLEIKKEKARTKQPFSVDGVLDFAILLDFYDWTDLHHWANDNTKYLDTPKDRQLNFESVQDWVNWMKGQDTNYPKTHGMLVDHGNLWNNINGVQKTKNRHISLAGDKERTLEKNGSYKVTSLGSAIPDHLAHLPVVTNEDL